MFGQPRCREWTPLATQQLRLRSLIQIVGYNIRPPERIKAPCRFYYTLHSTPMAAPFYMSEQLPSTHPKWREIDSESSQKMSSANVVIRIWCHMTSDTPAQEYQLANKNTSPQKLQDVVIETWGVYFNGLLHIGANLSIDFTANSFKENTLVFQMHGGYFCSYKSLKFETVVPNEDIALESSSSKSDWSKKHTQRSQHVPIEARFMQNQTYRLKETKSFSPTGNWRSDNVLVSKSHSPPSNTGFRQNFNRGKSSGSLNIGPNRDIETPQRRNRSCRNSERSNCDLDTNYIYEHSPSPCSDQDLKELCPSAAVLDCDNLNDLCNDEPQTKNDRLTLINLEINNVTNLLKRQNSKDDEKQKYRYSCLTFLKSEIRPSYNADKLRKLHLLQFLIKKKKDSVQDIKQRIYQKSAIELMYDSPNEKTDLNMQKYNKSRVKRNLFEHDEIKMEEKSKAASKNGKVSRNDKENSGFPVNDRRFTLSLNELLEIKSRPSPQQRWEHARLIRQLEIVRLKRALLVEQRDAKIAHVRLLKQQHAKLFEQNQDNGTELMQGYHTLSRGTCPEARKAKKQPAVALKALTVRSQRQLQARRGTMLHQLADIFYIEQVSDSYYSICGAPGLRVCGASSAVTCDKSTAAREAAAAGLAAQALTIAATILHQPLRHRIKLLGSASYIEDHLTHGLIDRHIPLFERGSPNLFQYGLFLLNGCVAQLLWYGNVQGGDARATLANLKRLMMPLQHKVSLEQGLDATRTLFDSDWSLATSPHPLSQPLPAPLVLPLLHPHSLRSLVAGDHRGNCSVNGRQFNRFKECVDGSCSLAGTKFEKKHRHSRSVGSYNDEKDLQTLNISTASMLGSEPVLSLHKNNLNLSDPQNAKQISTLNVDGSQKVIFTIGIHENCPQNWVKISTNNGDVSELESQCSNTECNDNFRKICTEISEFCDTECSRNENLDFCDSKCSLSSDFCDQQSLGKENAEFCDPMFSKNNFGDTNLFKNYFDNPNCSNIEIFNSQTHSFKTEMSKTVDIEEISCESCEKVVDGTCNEILCVNSVLQDVIVIPSAEAKIDTGENYRKRLNSNISMPRIDNSGVDNSRLAYCGGSHSRFSNSDIDNSNVKCLDIEHTSAGNNSEVEQSGIESCTANSSIEKYSPNGCGLIHTSDSNSEVQISGIRNSEVDNNSCIENSGIKNSSVDYSVVENSTVNNTGIKNSGVENSCIKNSRVDHSVVENSRVNNSGIKNSGVDTSETGSECESCDNTDSINKMSSVSKSFEENLKPANFRSDNSGNAYSRIESVVSVNVDICDSEI